MPSEVHEGWSGYLNDLEQRKWPMTIPQALQTLSQKIQNGRQQRAKEIKLHPIPVWENTLQPPPAPNSGFKKRQTRRTWLPAHTQNVHIWWLDGNLQLTSRQPKRAIDQHIEPAHYAELCFGTSLIMRQYWFKGRRERLPMCIGDY